jgi:mono/diheme cytochrome c family protein
MRNRKFVPPGVLLLLLAAGVAFGQAARLQPGLVGRASDGARTVTFLTPTANFTLAAEQSVHPQLRPAFKAEWNGVLTILRAGRYTIFASAKVFLDGREVQNQTVPLEAGEHALKVQFDRVPGPARLQLEWASDFFRREPIPASAFGHRNPPAELAATQQLERGRELAEELNCIACHRAAEQFIGGRRGPDLSQVGDRATVAWIFRWLENPRHFRASAVMPVLPGTAQDRADIAAYLASLKSPQPAKTVEATPTRIAGGRELFGKIGCAVCHGEGDSARHSLAGLGSKFTAGELARFLLDPLAVDASGRMPDLGLDASDAGALAAHLVQSKNADFEAPAPAGNILRGRQLVVNSGCANCHTIRDTQGTLTPHLEAAPLAALNPAKGCLAESPPARAASYALAPADREALRAFLQRRDVSEAPVQDFHRQIKAFNCAGCHELNGPAPATGESPPPALTYAGDKLRASWLQNVLVERKRVRPWMELRMPHYGDAVKPLVNLFAAQAGAELGEGATIPAPTREQIAAGIKLIGAGEGGLSCINCHDFRGEKSVGQLRGPDLTEMHARCRTDWLRRWLWEPSRIQPGTAMPAFFSDLPPARAEGMIASILHALWAGRDMPLPAGLGDTLASYVQKVGAEPVLFRTFMPDAPPRAIAVGLPGGQSYCFDAQNGRLRYVWSGEFVDMKPVWANRGGERAIPLGPRWFTPPDLAPLRVGNPDLEPTVKFKGYRLEQKVPVMLYEVNGVPVAEKITAVAEGRGIVREFQLGATKEDVWFLAPPVSGVKVTCSAGAITNGRVKIPGGKPARFTVTVTAQ